MMRTKNKGGFTLIETMIAVAMIGMIITPMFVLQTTVFTTVARIAEKFHRMVQAKQFSFAAFREQPPQAKDFKLEKKEERPISMVRYNFSPPSKGSSLANIKNLYRQEVIASGNNKDAPDGIVIKYVFKSEHQ